MNVSGLGIGSASSVTQNMKQAEIKVRSDIAPQATSTSPVAGSDTVSISDAAQKKLSTELGMAMNKNSATTKAQEQKSEELDTRTDIEKKIDKLKEEIKELQQERQALAGDKSAGADEKRKEIDNRMMMLSAQITTLLKAQKEEAEAASK
ncbi:hypothetical protein CXF83_20595 [Shewanella sp. Choline-02u-19]|uniref:hypothetical protein n=1 Tax=unclassified Shewanella TaxID=196818 RepID=UPI000C34D6A2|nr:MULTISPECIES: hypothetical protein [unclassified Shewanella]PKH53817.1 hypothetical protein CXF84_21325 [Shewanella sp. Bg11-22]PKI28931.1 hypothetical protein CXF83_20595 [Shewanella sp. Choline-02u-19]